MTNEEIENVNDRELFSELFDNPINPLFTQKWFLFGRCMRLLIKKMRTDRSDRYHSVYKLTNVCNTCNHGIACVSDIIYVRYDR